MKRNPKTKTLTDRACDAARRRYSASLSAHHARVNFARGYVAGWKARGKQK